jgi:hypothetical protein
MKCIVIFAFHTDVWKFYGRHTGVRYNFHKLQLCYNFHFIAKLLPSVLRTVTKINIYKMCNYYSQRRFHNCTCIFEYCAYGISVMLNKLLTVYMYMF